MKGYQGDIKRKAILFIGFVFLILLALNIFPELFGDNNIYMVPEAYEYKVRVPAQGIVVRDEKLYFANTEGDIFKVVKEGERVRVGQRVADILLLEDTTDLKEELSQIENILNFYDELLAGNGDDNPLNSNGVDLLVSRLHQQLSEGDYQGINDTKESISLYNETVQNFSGNIEGSGITTEGLNERRDYLLSRISQFNKSIHSLNSGIVSYEVDGWEEELVVDGINSIEADIFNRVQAEEGKGNNAVFKIIDDYQWYLLIDIADENQVDYEIGDSLDVLITTEDKRDIVEIRMPLVEIVEDREDKFYILRGTSFLEKVFDIRFANVEIIDLKEDTLRVPAAAIVEIDGKTGVKVKEFYGVVTFRPVEVLAIDERYAYVSKGDNNGYIEIGEESFRTISIFSEVIGKPNSVNLGDILN